MTTKNELREEQRRVIDENTPSLGYTAGEAVVEPQVIVNPGQVWTNGVSSYAGVVRLDKGLAVRAVSEDGAPETIDLSVSAKTTSFGLSVGLPIDEVNFFRRIPYEGNSDVTPDFDRFSGGGSGLSRVLVTLQASLGGVERRVIRTGVNSWRILYSRADPVWGPGERFSGDRLNGGSRSGRIMASYRSGQEAHTNMTRFDDYPVDRRFNERTFTSGWSFDPNSSKSDESRPSGGVMLQRTLESDGTYAVRVFGFDDAQSGVVFPQLSGYSAPRFEDRTGPITIPTEPTLIGPSNVDFRVRFFKGTTELSSQTLPLVNTNSIQTLSFSTDKIGADRFVIDTVPEYRLAWIRHFDVLLPRVFKDASVDYYPVANNDGFENQIKFYALGTPVRIPNIATVAGKRPNQYLTFSGTWNGTSFKEARTRCPVWLLYDVLTDRKYDLRIEPGRIDTKSFLAASQYCNGLIDGKPRWAYDGQLSGTQTEIVDTLLRLIDGSIRLNGDNTLSLDLERPGAAKWIICPANVLDDKIDYRRSSRQRSPIRVFFKNRLTGQGKATPGPANSKVIEVPWQDEDMCVRWAKWRNLREEALLDTVEFTMAWEGSDIREGDLVSVYDPDVVGLSNSGRVLSSGLTSDNRTWLQLNHLPVDFWPTQSANAQLLQPSGRTPLDPDLWGYVFVDFPSGPLITLQKPGGGTQRSIIKRAMWDVAGSIERNRIELINKIDVEDRTVWGAADAGNEPVPSIWRVQSITESADGREFSFIATRYLNGMHRLIEQDVPLQRERYRYQPTRGTNLSQFLGEFTRLNDSYPLPESIPFGYAGNFRDLISS